MTNTIRCVILDDELLALSYLKLLCEQMEGVEVVKAFNQPSLFLSEIGKLACDVCILDIEMPGMTGLQVAAQIPHLPVIFTTAYKEFAADAFDLNAVDYVRKPLQKNRLEQAFEKFRLRDNKPGTNFIEWNTGLGKTRIAADALLYVRTSEIDSRDKVAVLGDQAEITLKNINFRRLLDLLPERTFIQINKKEVLALKAVRAFSDSEIVTTLKRDGSTPLILHLTEAYRSAFSRMMDLR